MSALGLVVGLALASGAQAAAPASDQSAALQQAVGCLSVTDVAARAACYDTAIGAVAKAQARGDLIVMEAEQVEAVRRQGFGLAKPPEPFAPAKAAPVDQVSLTVGRVWRAPDGDWMMAMTDGQIWRQIDGRFARPPKAGSTAEVRRAFLGSYLLNLDGQTAVRARREE